jgi:hypothetical protein
MGSAVVGAPRSDSEGTNSGDLWLYRREGAAWGPPVRLTPESADAGDLLGFRVAIDGDRAYATAIGDGTLGGDNAHGAAWEFLIDGIDADMNGLLDECEAASTVSIWVCGGPHFFGEESCWLAIPPGPNGTARFSLDAATEVVLTDDVAIKQVDVAAGDVTLRMGGAELACKGPSAVTVAGHGEPPVLRVAEGLLRSTTGPATIGDSQSGAAGKLVVEATGALFLPWGLTLHRGELELMDGSVLDAPGGGVNVRPEGALVGTGDILGNLASAGLISPGADGVGGVWVLDSPFGSGGDFTQFSFSDPEAPAIGTLQVDITGPGAGVGHDLLAVEDEATLGGLLEVRLGAFDPPLGSSYRVLTAAELSGQFHVVLLPPAGDGKTLEIEYNSAGVLGGGTGVDVTVVASGAQFAFEESLELLLEGGQPFSAAIGQIDADPLPDVVIAVPNAAEPDSAPGDLLLLLNVQIGLDGVLCASQLLLPGALGAGPAGLALGDLNGAAGDELVVANSGDDTVQIVEFLKLSLQGDCGDVAVEIASQFLPAGDGPVDVAIADFTGDDLPDIVAVNAISVNLSTLVNLGFPSFQGYLSLHVDELDLSGLDPIDLKDPSDLGRPGVVVASRSGGAVHIFANTGTVPPFAGPTVKYAVGMEPVTVDAVDLDGDGADEILTCNAGDGSLTVLVPSDDGSFVPQISLDVSAAPKGPASLTTGDLDGDLDVDVALLAFDGALKVKVLRNESVPPPPARSGQPRPVGQVVLVELPASGRAATEPMLVLVGDVDADGDGDLVTISGPTAADGTAGVNSSLTALRNSLLSVNACDLDGDGAVAGADLGLLLAAWGGGAGPADINGDGVVDGADLGILLACWTD